MNCTSSQLIYLQINFSQALSYPFTNISDLQNSNAHFAQECKFPPNSHYCLLSPLDSCEGALQFAERAKNKILLPIRINQPEKSPSLCNSQYPLKDRPQLQLIGSLNLLNQPLSLIMAKYGSTYTMCLDLHIVY